MTAVCGKVLARRAPNGEFNEARVKVDFDRSQHLSIRKVTQRSLKRACIQYENDKKMMKELTRSKKLEEMIEDERRKREKDEQERLARRLIRLEKRKQQVFVCFF
jgi:hypothetical protein